MTHDFIILGDNLFYKQLILVYSPFAKMATAAEHIQDDAKMTITAERVKVLQRLGLEHATAYTEMQMLETYMEDLSKRALNSYLRGHTRQTIQVLLRHSVAESVRDVYDKYKFYKWFQILWLANKTVPDMYYSDSAFRQDISEVNTRLMQDMYSTQDENQEDVILDRKAAKLSALYSCHLRSC